MKTILIGIAGLLALSLPAVADQGDWRGKFADQIKADGLVVEAEWIDDELFWASVPDEGREQMEFAQSLCEYLTVVDAPDDAKVRIHLWSASQRQLGAGIVLGEAVCERE